MDPRARIRQMDPMHVYPPSLGGTPNKKSAAGGSPVEDTVPIVEPIVDYEDDAHEPKSGFTYSEESLM